jgi:hypothetical protein
VVGGVVFALQDGVVGSSIDNLYIVDVGSGDVRQITDTEGVETQGLYYMSPTSDPTGATFMFTTPPATWSETTCGPCR